MNLDLIKHIIKYELRWKAKYVRKTIFGIIGCLGLTLTLSEDFKELSALVFFIILFLSALSMQSSFMPSLNQVNQGAQASSFSWKYIHPSIKDRRSLIVGFLIAGIMAAMPIVIGTLFGLILLGFRFSAQELLISSVAFVLIATLFKLYGLLNSIQHPRRTYYEYNPEGFFKSVVYWIANNTSALLCLLYGIVAILSVTTVLGAINILYVYIAGTISLVSINLFLFHRVLVVWEDERESRPNLKRRIKRLILMTPVIVTLGYFGFDKKILVNENLAFDHVKNGMIKKVKQYNLEKIVNKLESDKGFYLLHEAAYYGQIPVAKYLLSKGAELDIKVILADDDYHHRMGWTPLHFSLANDQSEMAKFLISKGADVNSLSKHGVSPLMLATFRCNVKLMKALAEKGAEINHQTEKGMSALHLAVKGNCIVGMDYLIRNGINVKLQNSSGENYLEYAKIEYPLFYEMLEFRINN